MKTKIIFIILFLFFTTSIFSQAIKVEIRQKNGKWTLYRAGEPYFIEGAGGRTHLDELVNAGGNSIRIWSSEDAQQILDEAQKRGLTVMFGLWVQHERHGFDYNDSVAVKQQLEKFREIVTKFKDHPALLLWAVGNEVDLNYKNYKVWVAIEDIAAMIHKIDPNHPTATVTAGLHEKEVKLIKEKCPDIDIFGVNTYSEACSIADNIKKFGWTGAYIISEWGPNGHWEVPKTNWEVPIEQTSHQKALSYFDRYKCILTDSNFCIGSYVFLWGHKQETTSTWYGLFTKHGKETETIDYLQKSWTGNWPANRAPSLDSVVINNFGKENDVYLVAKTKYSAEVFVTDENPTTLLYKWEVYPESTDIKSGGDPETEPTPFKKSIRQCFDNKLIFKAPKKEGAYRLFITVTDANGKVAYANIPFYVKPK